MPNPYKGKGDRAERELVEALSLLLPTLKVERAYGAGRPDDTGDLDGLPYVAAQVKWWADPWPAVRSALDGASEQSLIHALPYAVGFVRYPKRPRWVVVMDLDSWALMYRDALSGLSKAETLP